MADDTERLVVELEARVTEFERAFNRANQTSARNWQSIEARGKQAADRLQAQLGAAAVGVGASLRGIATAFGSTIGLTGLGMTGFLATAVKINGELAKLDTLAKRAAISTDKLQEIKFAANIKGVDDANFEAGLDNSLRLLDEASRQTNDLRRLFNANSIAIRNQNGDLLSFDELLERAATLIANARTEQEKIKIADMLGLSRQWLSALKDGPNEFKRAGQEAIAAGFIIDKETVQRAKSFDKAWDAAIVRFKAGMTSALTDIASSFADFWSDVMDSVPGADFIRKAFEKWAGGLRSMSIPELEQAIQRAIEQGTGQFEVDRLQAEIDRRLGKKPLKVTVTPEVSDKPTVVPKDVEKNAFERAIEAARKSIATTNAEADSVGQLSEARERAKTIAELETAAIKANVDAGFQSTTVTDEQRKKINELADAMEAAAKRNRLAQKSWEDFNEALRFGGNLAVDFIDKLGDRTAKLADLLQSAVASLKRAALQAAITGEGPLAGLLGTKSSVSGGTGGILGALFGGFKAGGGPVVPSKAYVVGERGPEIFVPPSAGSIAPNSSLGGSMTSVHAPISVVVNAQGGSDPKQSAAMAEQVGKAVRDAMDAHFARALRQQMRPGGLLGR